MSERESIEASVARAQASSSDARRTGATPSASPGRAVWIAAALLALLYLAALVLLPVAPGAAGQSSPPATPLTRLIALLHVPVVLVGYLLVLVQAGLVGSARPDHQPRSPLARRAFAQVLLGLGLLAIAWSQLYVWLFTVWSGSDFLGTWVRGPKGLAVADAWNTLASFAFFYLYLVLDLPSVRSDDDAHRAVPFQRSLPRIACLCAGVALLALVGLHGWLGLGRLGPLAGSVLAAVSMMYVFGRFDYRFMRVPRAWIAPLYVYVAIQTAWHEIVREGGPYAEGLFLAALLLKVVLFALLCRWIRQRVLQRYLDFASL